MKRGYKHSEELEKGQKNKQDLNKGKQKPFRYKGRRKRYKTAFSVTHNLVGKTVLWRNNFREWMKKDEGRGGGGKEE